MADEREILTRELFGTATREVAEQVAVDYEPDMILSIARGGLLLGGALGYALAVKNTYTMNVEFYTGVDERLEVPRVLPPAPAVRGGQTWWRRRTQGAAGRSGPGRPPTRRTGRSTAGRGRSP